MYESSSSRAISFSILDLKSELILEECILRNKQQQKRRVLTSPSSSKSLLLEPDFAVSPSSSVFANRPRTLGLLSARVFLQAYCRRPTLKLESSIADISVAARGIGLQPLPAIGTFTRQMRLLIEGQDIRCQITVMI